MGYMCLSQFQFPQGTCLGVGLLGHIMVLFLVFKESPYCHLLRPYQFTFPTTAQESSLFPTPSPAFSVCRLLNDGHFDQSEVISHCSFDLHFSKIGEITRPFRYDINQIPYNYTVEVRNRFKGLDLIDRVPHELWMEVHDIVQEAGMKTIPKKKKCKEAKWLYEEVLQIAVKRREAKSKGEKERYTHLNAELQRKARKDKKAFLND